MDAANRPRKQNVTHHYEGTKLARDRTFRSNVRPRVKNQGCAVSNSELHSYRTWQNIHQPSFFVLLLLQPSTSLYKNSAPTKRRLSDNVSPFAAWFYAHGRRELIAKANWSSTAPGLIASSSSCLIDTPKPSRSTDRPCEKQIKSCSVP